MTHYPHATELHVSEWLNSPRPIVLSELRGQVVVVHAFQMLCPGCVSHAIPQMKRVAQWFEREPVQVLGLHSVFEHHSAMSPLSLRAFVHEYRITYPVGIDQAVAGQTLPRTMMAWQFRGTPTTVILDKMGRVRVHHFGRLEDLQLGAEIASLLAQSYETDELSTPSDKSGQLNAAPGGGARQAHASVSSGVPVGVCDRDSCAA